MRRFSTYAYPEGASVSVWSEHFVPCFTENFNDNEYDWYQYQDDLQAPIKRKGTYDYQYRLPAADYSAQHQPHSTSYNYSHHTEQDLNGRLGKIQGLVSGLRGDPSIYYTTDNSPEYSAYNYADVYKDENTLRNPNVEELPENQIKEKQAGAAASNLPVSP